jgi:hypothetical protein
MYSIQSVLLSITYHLFIYHLITYYPYQSITFYICTFSINPSIYPPILPSNLFICPLPIYMCVTSVHDHLCLVKLPMSPHWWLQPWSMACWVSISSSCFHEKTLGPLPCTFHYMIVESPDMCSAVPSRRPFAQSTELQEPPPPWAWVFFGFHCVLKALSTCLSSTSCRGLAHTCVKQLACLAPFCLPHWNPPTSWIIFKFEYVNVLSCCCRTAWVWTSVSVTCPLQIHTRQFYHSASLHLFNLPPRLDFQTSLRFFLFRMSYNWTQIVCNFFLSGSFT